MNADDPYEGTAAGFSYGWSGRAAGSGPGWERASAQDHDSILFPGAMALTPPAETSNQTSFTNYVPNSTSTSFTVSFNGPNVTFNPPSAAGNVTGSSFMPTSGYARPEPARLEIRRFYHWDKSATAGAAVAPEEAARPVAAEVASAHETLRVTETAAVRVVEDESARARESARRRLVVRRGTISPGSLTSVAMFLAGRRRPLVGVEWRGHLLGEHGSGLTQREQVRAARGFILAALQYRVRDAADLAWRPADAVLRSRFLSNLFVWGPVMVTLIAIVRHDGRYGLVTDDQDPAELGAFLYLVIRTGRWWRGIKPPPPKPRRAREADSGADEGRPSPEG